MIGLRRISNQMCSTLFCGDCGTLWEDEKYEYQEMKRSLLKKLYTTLFRRKPFSDESKKRCWDAYSTRILSSSSSEFTWRRILIANPHHRSHFAQSYHSHQKFSHHPHQKISQQKDSQSHFDFQNSFNHLNFHQYFSTGNCTANYLSFHHTDDHSSQSISQMNNQINCQMNHQLNPQLNHQLNPQLNHRLNHQIDR